jgi:poly-gamma-glutamate synthesis protein (capsule biosynthesis protein)
LASAGIKYAGAGGNLAQAQAPAVIEVAGKGRIIVFAFGAESSGIGNDWAAEEKQSGVNLLPDFSQATVLHIAGLVSLVKKPGDIVMASIHWGGNWGYQIDSNQRDFAHALIDNASIDVIHGHSSHHVKGIEAYKNRPIIYGCGDFINDYEGIAGYEQYRGDLGLMYLLTMDCDNGRMQRFEMTPTRIKKLQVNRASLEESQWLMKVLNREGERLGTHVEINEEGRLLLISNIR